MSVKRSLSDRWQHIRFSDGYVRTHQAIESPHFHKKIFWPVCVLTSVSFTGPSQTTVPLTRIPLLGAQVPVMKAYGEVEAYL